MMMGHPMTSEQEATVKRLEGEHKHSPTVYTWWPNTPYGTVLVVFGGPLVYKVYESGEDHKLNLLE